MPEGLMSLYKFLIFRLRRGLWMGGQSSPILEKEIQRRNAKDEKGKEKKDRLRKKFLLSDFLDGSTFTRCV
jgi:hypothetical protein